ncbi:type II toxin-antitoxin system PemK/MazF family toxin [Hippea alviniae]|uniref:type II toxin-antitoxin system PemK/MazF family toxin n=1 Tax=Hippea alviniae TaxID=1279027 RepID=UPI0003B75E18|nr:type II toxin-antitoxin system PemK/MazF family toxin [Hippea alviniae]
MTKYSFGDIVIIGFPYTNMNSAVMRPAVVLVDTGDEDVIVSKITSQKRDVDTDMDITNWQNKGLLRKSYVRLSKIATLNRRDIKKKISSLDEEDIKKAKSVLRKLFDL